MRRAVEFSERHDRMAAAQPTRPLGILSRFLLAPYFPKRVNTAPPRLVLGSAGDQQCR